MRCGECIGDNLTNQGHRKETSALFYMSYVVEIIPGITRNVQTTKNYKKDAYPPLRLK
jgi:hypothetical protein